MWSLGLECRCKIRMRTRGLVPEASPCDISLRLVPYCVPSFPVIHLTYWVKPFTAAFFLQQNMIFERLFGPFWLFVLASRASKVEILGMLANRPRKRVHSLTAKRKCTKTYN